MKIRLKKCLKNGKDISGIVRSSRCQTLHCSKEVAEMCYNGWFIIFPYGTLVALCSVQSASFDWLYLATDVRSLSTFPLNVVICPLSGHLNP